MELEHKFAQFGAQIQVEDGAVIAGYASLFDVPDQGGDVVLPGAYSTSLAQLSKDGRSVKMLWQHDPARPIGIWEEVHEDARGLFVKGRLLGDVSQGREAMALIAAGAIDGLSIGYRTRRAIKDAQGTRQLKEVELWEVSLVTFPMLPNARVAAKGEDQSAEAMRELAAVFDAARQDLAG